MIEPPIINEIPQIFYKYQEAFGADNVVWGKVIIAYDGAIYTAAAELSEDEIEHEKTHLRQQVEIGLEKWVDQYLHDPKFRLNMELEAYEAQCRYMRSHKIYSEKERQYRIHHFATWLSSPQYGSIISYEAAKIHLLK